MHWRLIATDDTNTYINQRGETVNYISSSIGTQRLDTSSISSFTSFADLTSSEVQAWVEDAMGADEVQALKDKLDEKIAISITPTSVTKTIG